MSPRQNRQFWGRQHILHDYGNMSKAQDWAGNVVFHGQGYDSILCWNFCAAKAYEAIIQSNVYKQA